MRGNEGPTKNLLLRRKRNVQQDTKTQSSCAGISISGAKEFKKLGCFSHNFAEITDENELGIHFPLDAEQNP